MFPKNARLENSFLEYVIGKNTAWPVKRCLERGQRCTVLMLDLNKDKRNEYIVFRYSSRWDHSGTVLTKSEKSWRHVGNLNIVTGTESGDFEKLHAKLAQGDYSAVDDPWQDLRIGGQVQRFKPE